jgi:DNA-binding NarL/FixJ family response regulator
MTTVLFCSDEPVLAQGLARILEATHGLELCAYCPNLDALPAQVDRYKPDILVLDMTAETNFGVLARLQEAPFQSKVVLWAYSLSTELALQALSLGIRGILRKTHSAETLIRCLTRIGAGELWFDKTFTDSLATARRYSLTWREGQLVTLLCEGLKNKEIATILRITEGTVKVYLSRLFEKLDVKDRFELALVGLKNLTHGQGLSLAEGPSGSPRALRSFFVERVPPQSEMRPAQAVRLYR